MKLIGVIIAVIVAMGVVISYSHEPVRCESYVIFDLMPDDYKSPNRIQIKAHPETEGWVISKNPTLAYRLFIPIGIPGLGSVGLYARLNVELTETPPWQEEGFLPTASFGDGAEHIIVDKVTLGGYMFESNADYPLAFKLVKGRGYVYLCGKGKVTDTSGKSVVLGEKDTPEMYLPLLKSKDDLHRQAAAIALGWLPIPDKMRTKVVSALKKSTKDPIMEVRRNAAEALGKVGSAESIETLVALLEDNAEEWWVAEVAAEAISTIGSGMRSETTQSLVNNLMKSNNHKERAVKALALSAAGRQAVDTLIYFLQDNESIVRRNAAWGLGIIGDKRARANLERLLEVEEDDEVKTFAQEALTKLRQ